jgi:hypothetical protein
MLHLELSEKEQEVLTYLLDNSLPTLEVEIQRTDGFEFKDMLKERRDAMESLKEKLTHAKELAAR